MSYFRLLEDMTKLRVHPVPFDSTTQAFLNPQNANPLLMGEWVEPVTGGTTEEWQRATGALPCRCYYLERGRMEPQILGKGSVIEPGGWEAETQIMTAAGITEGAPLKVSATVSFGGVNKSGIILHTGAADADWVIGYAVRLAANNGGYLRFATVSLFRMA